MKFQSTLYIYVSLENKKHRSLSRRWEFPPLREIADKLILGAAIAFFGVKALAF